MTLVGGLMRLIVYFFIGGLFAILVVAYLGSLL